MLYNICYITSNWRLYNQRGFCHVARCWLYNKTLCYIAHPNLPDVRILAKNHDFRFCESLQKSICETLRNLAKTCETINYESLWNMAKHCETIFANLRESLRKPAKTYLRNLAKSKYFCESIFAKACENTCILHVLILAKTLFERPCCRCIYHVLLAPPTETLWNHICKFARKLAKASENIFAKSCEI